MRSFGKLAAAAIIAATTFSSTASAVPVTETLTFESQPVGNFVSMNLGNFTLNYIGFGDLQSVGILGGGRVLVDSNPTNFSGAETILRRSDLSAFDVLSFDIVDLAGGGGGPFALNIGGTNYAPFTTGTLQTISAPASLLGITGLDMNIVSGLISGGGDFAIDNIVVRYDLVEQVPEAATLGLFGLGLAGLGLAARRRKIA